MWPLRAVLALFTLHLCKHIQNSFPKSRDKEMPLDCPNPTIGSDRLHSLNLLLNYSLSNGQKILIVEVLKFWRPSENGLCHHLEENRKFLNGVTLILVIILTNFFVQENKCMGFMQVVCRKFSST